LFAGNADPVVAITEHARATVMKALDMGWTGPPFDPIALAELLRIPVRPRDDVADARTVPSGSGVTIEFNPNRPPTRLRYSVAHEIAHTFFPDCAERVRHRLARDERTRDTWELETLCNIAAAELLMPAGSFRSLDVDDLQIETLLSLRQRFAVSTEALLIRVIRSTPGLPSAAFCASRIERGTMAGRYRLDYVIASAAWDPPVSRGTVLPATTAVADCVAIGHTASSTEGWTKGDSVHVEAVAIPGYPGASVPRVVGLVTGAGMRSIPSSPLHYVRGDATRPRGEGRRLIVHVVNDATATWGGGGFAAAIRRTFPTVQDDFREWVAADRDALRLGQVHLAQVNPEVAVASLVAQRGYGASVRPRIRYEALARCLNTIGELARTQSAGIHMPRIGAGQAGGAWDVISDIVVESVCARGVPVTVYDLPGATPAVASQRSLPFGSRQ
jgi:O-acetyl-ADP-ribose deacetylase (regulator of RNase III)